MSDNQDNDRIEVSLEIAAPVARVWRALSDYEEFGQWFHAKLDRPFAVGEVSTGHITEPGYEHHTWVAIVREIEPEQRFAFEWCPGAGGVDDFNTAPKTLVEFTLTPTATGTHLTICESGFAALPPELRDISFRENSAGWEEQKSNILNHVLR